MRAQDLAQPLTRSIWRSVIEDWYIDLEKLFATMDPGYNPNDDAKNSSTTSERSCLTWLTQIKYTRARIFTSNIVFE